MCEARCPPGDGCRQHFEICLPFGETAGCSVTLSSSESEFPNRWYCVDGQVCVVADVTFEAEEAVGGACVRADYCRELESSSIEARCMWSDETEFVDGSPDVATCPETSHPDVTFCGGPCGGCPLERWRLSRYRNDASCTGVSERRGFGVCTFNGDFPCSQDDPGVADTCVQETDWGEPCACLLMELPDGTFNEVGYPTLARSCLEYQAHFPDSIRCMDPIEWVPLEP